MPFSQIRVVSDVSAPLFALLPSYVLRPPPPTVVDVALGNNVRCFFPTESGLSDQHPVL